jgi:hypothetical protein
MILQDAKVLLACVYFASPVAWIPRFALLGFAALLASQGRNMQEKQR